MDVVVLKEALVRIYFNILRQRFDSGLLIISIKRFNNNNNTV